MGSSNHTSKVGEGILIAGTLYSDNASTVRKNTLISVYSQLAADADQQKFSDSHVWQKLINFCRMGTAIPGSKFIWFLQRWLNFNPSLARYSF